MIYLFWWESKFAEMIYGVINHTHGAGLAAMAWSRVSCASWTSHAVLSVPDRGQYGTGSTGTSRTLEGSVGRTATVESMRVPDIRSITGDTSVVNRVQVRSCRSAIAFSGCSVKDKSWRTALAVSSGWIVVEVSGTRLAGFGSWVPELRQSTVNTFIAGTQIGVAWGANAF